MSRANVSAVVAASRKAVADADGVDTSALSERHSQALGSAIVTVALADDLDEARALLCDFDRAIDCDVIQFGRDGECALAADGGCWGHRRLAFLERTK